MDRLLREGALSSKEEGLGGWLGSPFEQCREERVIYLEG